MNEPQIFSVIVQTWALHHNRFSLINYLSRRRKFEFQIHIWSDWYESQISMYLSVIGYDFVFGVLLI